MAWRVKVRLGAITMESTGPFDPSDPPTDLPAVLSSRWVDELDDSRPWPSQQVPSTGTLRVLFAQASDAAAIKSGTVVRVEVFSPPAAVTPLASFHGRVADLELVPDPLGVVATMPMADFRADLAQNLVGDSAWPAEAMEDRVARAFTAAGRTPPPLPPAPEPQAVEFNDLGYALGTFDVSARAAGPANLWEIVSETTRAGVWTLGERTVPGGPFEPRGIYGMMELVPGLNGAGEPDPTQTWTYVVLHNDAQPYPAGDLGLAAGQWGVTFPDAIPSDRVAFDSKWTRPLASAYNTVGIVTGERVIGAASNIGPGETRKIITVESIIRDTAAANDVADWLLPAPGALSGWQPGEFRVLVDEAPEGWWPGTLRDVRAITELPTIYHPEGGRWWAGAVASVETYAAEGRLEVTLGLRPVPLSPPASPIAWDDLPAAMTWANTDATTTWADLELVEII